MSAIPGSQADAGMQFPHSPLIALRQSVARGAAGYFSAGDGRIDFSDLDRRSDQFANFLSECGVRTADRVAALMDNGISFIVAMLGCMKHGAIWAPVNTSFRGEWLRHQLVDSEPALLIVDGACVDALATVRESLPARCRLLLHQAAGAWPYGHCADFDDYLSAGAGRPAFQPEPDGISHLIYTSGTTGRSKGCLISHNYLCNYARLLQQNAPRQREEVLYSPLPLFHLAATAHLVLNLVLGAGAHFARRFSVSGLWDEVERTKASYVHLMGTMASLVAAAPDTAASRRCFGKVRVLASAWSSETAARLKERFGIGCSDLRMYGQTEAAFLATLRGHPLRERTIGLPTDSFDVRIVDEVDREVSRCQVGEIAYRPRQPNVMFSGYWRNPQASWDRCSNLWWHSGDFGWQDEEGYLYFSDRGDDRMRRGGENISSLELEQAFLAHPDLQMVAAHAVPCEWGEDEVKIVAVPRAGTALSAQDLWTWAIPRVPRFALPRYIELRGDLPRNPTGKVLKYELRKDGVTPGTWDRAAAGIPAPER